MPITVAMIEEKEFKVKMRGYDPEEVDEFLDEICDEMVAMQQEIATLQSRLKTPVASAPDVPAPTPAPTPIPAPVAVPEVRVVEKVVEKPVDRSEAAQKLLARAQKVYDETVADAKAEAEEILKNARVRADSGVEVLQAEKKELENEIEMLRATAKDYKERFLRLIEDQQHVLNAETKLFE